MMNYQITIILTDGNQIQRTITIKPRKLRKALRQAIKGRNVLFGGADETYLVFNSQISRLHVKPQE